MSAPMIVGRKARSFRLPAHLVASEAVKAMEPSIKLGGTMKRHVADSRVAEHMPSLPG
jgi:hypothetical protein